MSKVDPRLNLEVTCSFLREDKRNMRNLFLRSRVKMVLLTVDVENPQFYNLQPKGLPEAFCTFFRPSRLLSFYFS